MPVYDKKTLEQLIDGDLPWHELKQIIGESKDGDRFEKILEILQEKVDWDEMILLPLHEHLFIVSKSGERIIKCECGNEFGDYRVNWKKECRIRVRDTIKEIEELYLKDMGCDPEWMEIREYYCPKCFTLLETETVPPGYPLVFNFLPEIDVFYKEWLGRNPPDRNKL